MSKVRSQQSCRSIFVAICLMHYLCGVQCLPDTNFFLWPSLQQATPELVPGDSITVRFQGSSAVPRNLSIHCSSDKTTCPDCLEQPFAPRLAPLTDWNITMILSNWNLPCQFRLQETTGLLVASGTMVRFNGTRDPMNISTESTAPQMPPITMSIATMTSFLTSSTSTSETSTPDSTETPSTPSASPVDFLPACPAINPVSMGIGIGIGTVAGTLLATVIISIVLLLYRRRSEDLRRQKYMSKPLPLPPKLQTPASTSKFSSRSNFSAPPVYQSPQRKGGHPTGLRRPIGEKEIYGYSGAKPLTVKDHEHPAWL